MQQIEQLKEYLKESKHTVFFGGAGVSTESGIPDFRSKDGLYNQKYDYPPETIISHTFFVRNPDIFYRFYREKMLWPDAQPNQAHLALAKLEAEGRLAAVITQNIDGLHQAAGSRNVLELHGSVHRNYCQKCGRFYDLTALMDMPESHPAAAGGIVKPDVVLYEEGLDPDVMEKSIAQITKADLLIVGGTSLAVYPAAGFLHYFRGRHLVLINKSSTPLDSSADLLISASIGGVLAKACQF